MRLHARIFAIPLTATLVAGCAALGVGDDYVGAQSPGAYAQGGVADPAGPAGDYPVVLGPSYTIGEVTYRPDDALNYDEVGYAVRDSSAGPGVTASHHTLPLPSYIEVTELNEGRTALVRVERRGPMASNDLLALSPDAMAQLGISGTPPVRVRRVNPPELERAKLRAGAPTPMRIETPQGLLTVLRRKLPEAPVAGSIRPTLVPSPAVAPSPKPTATPAPAPMATPTPVPAATTGYFVQAGAYSEKSRADRVAVQIDAEVYPAGRLWRVRSGPFATAAEANRDLARIRAAGFRDARVVRED